MCACDVCVRARACDVCACARTRVCVCVWSDVCAWSGVCLCEFFMYVYVYVIITTLIKDN